MIPSAFGMTFLARYVPIMPILRETQSFPRQAYEYPRPFCEPSSPSPGIHID